MKARKVGVEEELMLVDPASGLLTGIADRVLRANELQDQPSAADVEAELFRQQIETATEPCVSLDDLAAQLRSGRRTLIGLAARAGAAAAAMPVPVLADGDDDDVTRKSRYQQIQQGFGELARTSLACAMHVHVEVDGPEQGVQILDRIRGWLPVLTAVSANSPYFRGRDTGYASWRTQVWARWPSRGTGEAFGSAEVYDRVRRALTDWGAALDDGMVYFDARLSVKFPTLEVRVADVCTDLDDAVLVAALTRALVATLAEDGSDDSDRCALWRSDLLRAAAWRASRYGLTDRLVHPTEQHLAPARDVLAALVRRVRPALEEAGDAALVDDLTERLLVRGGGAASQREVFEKQGSLADVVADLVRRTEGSVAVTS